MAPVTFTINRHISLATHVDEIDVEAMTVCTIQIGLVLTVPPFPADHINSGRPHSNAGRFIAPDSREFNVRVGPPTHLQLSQNINTNSWLRLSVHGVDECREHSGDTHHPACNLEIGVATQFDHD